MSNSKSDYFDTQFVTFMLRSDLFLDKVIISIRDLFVKYGIRILVKKKEQAVQIQGKFLCGFPSKCFFGFSFSDNSLREEVEGGEREVGR